MFLEASETGWKFDVFSQLITLRQPQISGPFWGKVNALLPGLHYSNSRIHETESRGPETEPGNLETDLTVHRIHDTLQTGLQRVLRSLVAPRKEGSLDFQPDDPCFQPDDSCVPTRGFVKLCLNQRISEACLFNKSVCESYQIARS